MYRVKSESDSEMIPQDQMDSPLADDGNSGGGSPARGGGGGPVLKKGPWTSAEDAILVDYVNKHGEGNWNAVQKNTGLFRCGKSCRLRWANHLRPNLKKGAFTPDEEKIIIELHARMGNKWARMAAHLPGRTDNEIKNYWNTRIKRCQRAGIPIYPANICHQSSNEDQHCSTDFSSGEKLANDLMPGNGLYMPDFTCDNIIGNPEAFYPLHLPATCISNMLGQSFSSKNYGFMDQVNQDKVLKESESLVPGLSDTINGVLPSIDQFSNESEKFKQAFDFGNLYGISSGSKTLAPFGGALTGSHAFLNGNFSASRPTTGPLKMELPSLQDTESDHSDWVKYPMASATPLPELVDPYIQSPTATPSVKSECVSPRNSGLLEALLHEAHGLSTVKNQHPSLRSSSSSIGTPCDTTVASPELDLYQEYWEEHAGSFFNEYTPPVSGHSLSGSTPPVSAASPDEFQLSKISPELSATFGCGEHTADLKYELGDASPHTEFLRPDALLGSNLLEESSQNMTDQAVFNGAIAMLLGKDVEDESKPIIPDAPSALNYALSFDSSSWNNRTRGCEMSKFQ